jgi:DNA repair photolyase
MVVRDRDVLLDLTRAAGCTVYMSVPSVDEDAWRTLEPGTAHPMQRLRAVRELIDAGVNAGVLMAPIVPGFTSARSKLERTVKAIADHGARFVGCSVMHLQGGTRTHFLNFIRREFPSMVPRFERLYATAYAPAAYREEAQGIVRVLQSRYGLAKREDAVRPGDLDEPVPDPEQVGFSW